MNSTKSSEKILLLHKWPLNFLENSVVNTKIFIKEGLLHGDWKSVFANKKIGGTISLPQGVIRGFKDLHLNCDVNTFDSNTHYKTVYAIKDVRCVNWALKQKRKGLVDRLIVGPLIVNLPFENEGVIEDPLIDTVLLPSDWVVQVFKKHGKRPDTNYQVWSMGVDTEYWKPQPDVRRDKILLYVKNPEQKIVEKVVSSLLKRDLPHHILRAGAFTQQEYLQRLQESRAVIFLSRTETQGLAMFESWSCDVPSFHWNCGHYKYFDYSETNASSCPYLTETCGMDFQSENDFDIRWESFLSKLPDYKPRDFVMQNHRLDQSIKNLLRFSADPNSLYVDQAHQVAHGRSRWRYKF
jgi:glycosyltransferase involved in cell wall biosynthesis